MTGKKKGGKYQSAVKQNECFVIIDEEPIISFDLGFGLNWLLTNDLQLIKLETVG